MTALEIGTRTEITDLLQRYCTAIDLRDWVLFRSVFTDSAHLDYGPALGVFEDADTFTETMRAGHAPLGRTIHRVTNIVAEPGRPIVCRSYGDNINMSADGSGGHHGAAYYNDEITSTDEGLKISRRVVTMVVFEPVTTNLLAANPEDSGSRPDPD